MLMPTFLSATSVVPVASAAVVAASDAAAAAVVAASVAAAVVAVVEELPHPAKDRGPYWYSFRRWGILRRTFAR